MKRKFKPISEDEVRRKVEKKFEERAGLIQHLISFLIVNCIVWAIYVFSSGGFPWPLFVTGGWGIGVAFHIADYYYNHGGGAGKREAAIKAEFERQYSLAQMREELARRDLYEEDGHEDAVVYDLDEVELRHVRLTDDGEFSDGEMVDDLDEWERRQSR